MSNYFLSQKKIYVTNKSNHDFLDGLIQSIVWKSKLGIFNIRNQHTYKDYEGYAKNDFFCIRRILKVGANSFIPIVEGKVREDRNKKTVIEVTFTLLNYTRIFFLVMNLFIFILTIFLFLSGNAIGYDYLHIFLFITMLWTITYVCFKTEVDTADEFIKSLL